MPFSTAEWEPEENLSREDKPEAASIFPPIAAQPVCFVLLCRKAFSFVRLSFRVPIFITFKIKLAQKVIGFIMTFS